MGISVDLAGSKKYPHSTAGASELAAPDLPNLSFRLKIPELNLFAEVFFNHEEHEGHEEHQTTIRLIPSLSLLWLKFISKPTFIPLSLR